MILNRFEGINDSLSNVSLDKIVLFVKSLIPDIKNKARTAFYIGGELKYMKLMNYPLQENHLFKDREHSYIINAKAFKDYNKKIFDSFTILEMESRMPEDSKWMHGARACSAIAQALCEKYKIESIIPSDSNTAHGMLRQEFRYVTLSGSFRKHLDYILDIKKHIEKTGTVVLSPRFSSPKNSGE
ncbi:MAG: hypothetical protein PHY30_01420 [Candidatus Pacebacteria bacterium]|nr:hypothetical protein [Candidatus Paceibacterota bacterium]